MGENILNHNMELLKAAMPYVDSSAQSFICLLLGFYEFMDCLYCFNSGSMSACNYEGRKVDLEAMLNSIRPKCNKKEQEIVDRILSIFNAKRMFDMYNTYMAAMKAMQEFSEFTHEASGDGEGYASEGSSCHDFSSDSREPEGRSTDASDNGPQTCGPEAFDSENPVDGTDNMMEMLKDMIPPEQMETFKNLSMLFQSMSYDDNKKTE